MKMEQKAKKPVMISVGQYIEINSLGDGNFHNDYRMITRDENGIINGAIYSYTEKQDGTFTYTLTHFDSKNAKTTKKEVLTDMDRLFELKAD